MNVNAYVYLMQYYAVNTFPSPLFNTNTQISISGGLDFHVMKFTTTNPMTTKLNISTDVSGVNMSLDFFRLVGTNIAPDGSMSIPSGNTQQNKDFLPSTTYFLVFSSNTPMRINFKPDAEKFKQPVIFDNISFSIGEYTRGDVYVKKPPKPVRDCFAELRYRMVGGTLPPKLEINKLGIITGMIDNLDCGENASEFSPSFNWFYKDHDNRYQPYGRQWLFEAIVYFAKDSHIIDSMEEVDLDYLDSIELPYDIKTFCVKVYNNWDWDRVNISSNTKVNVSTVTPIVEYETTGCDTTSCIDDTGGYSHLNNSGELFCDTINPILDGYMFPDTAYIGLEECEFCDDPTVSFESDIIIFTGDDDYWLKTNQLKKPTTLKELVTMFYDYKDRSSETDFLYALQYNDLFNRFLYNMTSNELNKTDEIQLNIGDRIQIMRWYREEDNYNRATDHSDERLLARQRKQNLKNEWYFEAFIGEILSDN